MLETIIPYILAFLILPAIFVGGKVIGKVDERKKNECGMSQMEVEERSPDFGEGVVLIVCLFVILLGLLSLFQL